MKKSYIIGAFLSLAIVGNGIAQEAESLVKNPSFEGTKGKLKRLKQINKAVDWLSATELRADLFSGKKEGLPISVPENVYGKEEASDGINYAGVVMYSFNNRESRTYISNELSQRLKKDVRYCIRFNVSLADLSKYAVNNLGAYLSKKDLYKEGKHNIVLSKQKEIDNIIKISNNKIFEKRYSWETVCGDYIAKGGEKFITIGNFDENIDTKYKKLKKKKDFRGSQIKNAYYYIDEVSVRVLEDGEKCACGEVDEKEIERVIYSKQNTSLDGFTVAQIVENSTVYFAYLQSDLLPRAKEDLDLLAGRLLDSTQYRIEIKGHTTEDEMKAAKSEELYSGLSGRRIDAVIEYLKSHGIDEDRFETEIMEDSDPDSAEGTLVGKAKNRRVAFKLLK